MNYVPLLIISILWLTYFILRVILFKSQYIQMKKHLLILILEDNFIAAEIIVVYLTISKYIYKGYINLLYCLALIVFLIPSIMVQYIFKKNKI